MPPELSAALSVLALGVVALLTVVVKRALKNNKTKTLPPPEPAPSAVTATGSHVTIGAMIGEQLEIHNRPLVQRLERIEQGQQTHNERLGEMGERLAGVEARLDERTRT